MTDIWTKLAVFLGRLVATTLILCAWALIIVVTLKLLWFVVFRILV